jgi:hypothetical protein
MSRLFFRISAAPWGLVHLSCAPPVNSLPSRLLTSLDSQLFARRTLS